MVSEEKKKKKLKFHCITIQLLAESVFTWQKVSAWKYQNVIQKAIGDILLTLLQKCWQYLMFDFNRRGLLWCDGVWCYIIVWGVTVIVWSKLMRKYSSKICLVSYVSYWLCLLSNICINMSAVNVLILHCNTWHWQILIIISKVVLCIFLLCTDRVSWYYEVGF